MIIRSSLSENEILRRKIKALSGKQTKDKTISLIKELVKALEKIYKLDRYPSLQKDAIQRIIQELARNQLTTSNEDKLLELLVCKEDTDQLLDDMMHLESEATYSARLENILGYLKDYHAKKYSSEISFYEETSDKLDVQIKSVSKDIQFRLSKLQHNRKNLVEEIEYLEKSNINLAKEIKDIHKEKVQYLEKARTIQDQHQRIDFNKGSIELIRKNVRSYQMLVDLLNQLAILDQHHKHLKLDGYIRKLIQRLYRKPEQLDLLENTTDLVQIVDSIKNEIIQVESIIAPAQKMVFKDSQSSVDEDLIEKYSSMEE
jgi:hypothetical protein